jgi:hypothetical protein
MEERLRGGDRKIGACLLVETLRVPDAEKIAAALAHEFHRTEIGVYQLLCEITAERPSPHSGVRTAVARALFKVVINFKPAQAIGSRRSRFQAIRIIAIIQVSSRPSGWAASKGRTHDCKRPLCCTRNYLLPGGGHSHEEPGRMLSTAEARVGPVASA